MSVRAVYTPIFFDIKEKTKDVLLKAEINDTNYSTVNVQDQFILDFTPLENIYKNDLGLKQFSPFFNTKRYILNSSNLLEEDGKKYLTFILNGKVKREFSGTYSFYGLKESEPLDVRAGDRDNTVLLAKLNVEVTGIVEKVVLPAGADYNMVIPPEVLGFSNYSDEYRIIHRRISTQFTRAISLAALNTNIKKYQDTFTEDFDLISDGARKQIFQSFDTTEDNEQMSALFKNSDDFDSWEDVFDYVQSQFQGNVMNLLFNMYSEYSQRYPPTLQSKLVSDHIKSLKEEDVPILSELILATEIEWLNHNNGTISVVNAKPSDYGLYFVQRRKNYKYEWLTHIVFDVSIVNTIYKVTEQVNPEKMITIQNKSLLNKLKYNSAISKWNKIVPQNTVNTISHLAREINYARTSLDQGKKGSSYVIGSVTPLDDAIYYSYLIETELEGEENGDQEEDLQSIDASIDGGLGKGAGNKVKYFYLRGQKISTTKSGYDISMEIVLNDDGTDVEELPNGKYKYTGEDLGEYIGLYFIDGKLAQFSYFSTKKSSKIDPFEGDNRTGPEGSTVHVLGGKKANTYFKKNNNNTDGTVLIQTEKLQFSKSGELYTIPLKINFKLDSDDDIVSKKITADKLNTSDDIIEINVSDVKERNNIYPLFIALVPIIDLNGPKYEKNTYKSFFQFDLPVKSNISFDNLEAVEKIAKEAQIRYDTNLNTANEFEKEFIKNEENFRKQVMDETFEVYSKMVGKAFDEVKNDITKDSERKNTQIQNMATQLSEQAKTNNKDVSDEDLSRLQSLLNKFNEQAKEKLIEAIKGTNNYRNRINKILRRDTLNALKEEFKKYDATKTEQILTNIKSFPGKNEKIIDLKKQAAKINNEIIGLLKIIAETREKIVDDDFNVSKVAFKKAFTTIEELVKKKEKVKEIEVKIIQASEDNENEETSPENLELEKEKEETKLQQKRENIGNKLSGSTLALAKLIDGIKNLQKINTAESSEEIRKKAEEHEKNVKNFIGKIIETYDQFIKNLNQSIGNKLKKNNIDRDAPKTTKLLTEYYNYYVQLVTIDVTKNVTKENVDSVIDDIDKFSKSGLGLTSDVLNLEIEYKSIISEQNDEKGLEDTIERAKQFEQARRSGAISSITGSSTVTTNLFRLLEPKLLTDVFILNVDALIADAVVAEGESVRLDASDYFADYHVSNPNYEFRWFTPYQRSGFVLYNQPRVLRITAGAQDKYQGSYICALYEKVQEDDNFIEATIDGESEDKFDLVYSVFFLVTIEPSVSEPERTAMLNNVTKNMDAYPRTVALAKEKYDALFPENTKETLTRDNLYFVLNRILLRSEFDEFMKTIAADEYYQKNKYDHSSTPRLPEKEADVIEDIIFHLINDEDNRGNPNEKTKPVLYVKVADLIRTYFELPVEVGSKGWIPNNELAGADIKPGDAEDMLRTAINSIGMDLIHPTAIIDHKNYDAVTGGLIIPKFKEMDFIQYVNHVDILHEEAKLRGKSFTQLPMDLILKLLSDYGLEYRIKIKTAYNLLRSDDNTSDLVNAFNQYLLQSKMIDSKNSKRAISEFEFIQFLRQNNVWEDNSDFIGSVITDNQKLNQSELDVVLETDGDSLVISKSSAEYLLGRNSLEYLIPQLYKLYTIGLDSGSTGSDLYITIVDFEEFLKQNNVKNNTISRLLKKAGPETSVERITPNRMHAWVAGVMSARLGQLIRYMSEFNIVPRDPIAHVKDTIASKSIEEIEDEYVFNALNDPDYEQDAINFELIDERRLAKVTQSRYDYDNFRRNVTIDRVKRQIAILLNNPFVDFSSNVEDFLRNFFIVRRLEEPNDQFRLPGKRTLIAGKYGPIQESIINQLGTFATSQDVDNFTRLNAGISNTLRNTANKSTGKYAGNVLNNKLAKANNLKIKQNPRESDTDALKVPDKIKDDFDKLESIANADNDFSIKLAAKEIQKDIVNDRLPTSEIKTDLIRILDSEIDKLNKQPVSQEPLVAKIATLKKANISSPNTVLDKIDNDAKELADKIEDAQSTVNLKFNEYKAKEKERVDNNPVLKDNVKDNLEEIKDNSIIRAALPNNIINNIDNAIKIIEENIDPVKRNAKLLTQNDNVLKTVSNSVSANQKSPPIDELVSGKIDALKKNNTNDTKKVEDVVNNLVGNDNIAKQIVDANLESLNELDVNEDFIRKISEFYNTENAITTEKYDNDRYNEWKQLQGQIDAFNALPKKAYIIDPSEYKTNDLFDVKNQLIKLSKRVESTNKIIRQYNQRIVEIKKRFNRNVSRERNLSISRILDTVPEVVPKSSIDEITTLYEQNNGSIPEHLSTAINSVEKGTVYRDPASRWITQRKTIIEELNNKWKKVIDNNEEDGSVLNPLFKDLINIIHIWNDEYLPKKLERFYFEQLTTDPLSSRFFDVNNFSFQEILLEALTKNRILNNQSQLFISIFYKFITELIKEFAQHAATPKYFNKLDIEEVAKRAVDTTLANGDKVTLQNVEDFLNISVDESDGISITIKKDLGEIVSKLGDISTSLMKFSKRVGSDSSINSLDLRANINNLQLASPLISDFSSDKGNASVNMQRYIDASENNEDEVNDVLSQQIELYKAINNLSTIISNQK